VKKCCSSSCMQGSKPTMGEVLCILEPFSFGIWRVHVQKFGEEFDSGLGAYINGFHERNRKCCQKLKNDIVLKALESRQTQTNLYIKIVPNTQFTPKKDGCTTNQILRSGKLGWCRARSITSICIGSHVLLEVLA
jgi:hypothetical protein